MTDNEIMKALECCGNIDDPTCKECVYYETYNASCVVRLMRDVLDLLNRQKAEVERLKADNQECNTLIDMQDKVLREQTAAIEELDADCKKYKAERDEFANHFGKACEVGRVDGIKEFAERLKGIITKCPKNFISITAKDIDNLVKEMEGETDDK